MPISKEVAKIEGARSSLEKKFSSQMNLSELLDNTVAYAKKVRKQLEKELYSNKNKVVCSYKHLKT